MQTHNFTATYQEGIVSAVDVNTHKVRCKIPALDDLETAWLHYPVPNAGGNQFYCLPDVGELLALILDARGEGGCVLGQSITNKTLCLWRMARCLCSNLKTAQPFHTIGQQVM